MTILITKIEEIINFQWILIWTVRASKLRMCYCFAGHYYRAVLKISDRSGMGNLHREFWLRYNKKIIYINIFVFHIFQHLNVENGCYTSRYLYWKTFSQPNYMSTTLCLWQQCICSTNKTSLKQTLYSLKNFCWTSANCSQIFMVSDNVSTWFVFCCSFIILNVFKARCVIVSHRPKLLDSMDLTLLTLCYCWRLLFLVIK